MSDDKETIDTGSVTSGSVVPSAGVSDRAAGWGGAFLILTALITAVMVYARVASDADQGTFAESLRAVAENRGMYSLFGAARLASGLTLLAAGWFLLRTWISRDRWATPWVPYLFIASGVCTAVSGAARCGVVPVAGGRRPA